MLEFECPHCNEILNIPEQFVGTTGTCRKCGNSITIELKSTLDPSQDFSSFQGRPPNLVAVHCETTGPSSRKNSISELAGIKFSLLGSEVDTFWSYADPGHPIPPKAVERNGITDDMVAGAPQASEVVKQFFDWTGLHTVLFSHHAHSNSKFVAASLLKGDVVPPQVRVVDIISWSRILQVPVGEHRLSALMDYIGQPSKDSHRALDTCHEVAAVTAYLIKRQIGVHMEEESPGVLSRWLSRKTESVNEEEAFKAIFGLSSTIEKMCGPDFYEKARYELRLNKAKTLGRAEGGAEEASASSGNGSGHSPQWYEEIHVYLEDHHDAEDGVEDEIPGNSPWEYVLLEASQCDDTAERNRLCLEAVSLGARDPWPFERLTGFYIKKKDYKAAQEICTKYFELDNWKVRRWTESSLRLLRRLQKLEEKLALSS